MMDHQPMYINFSESAIHLTLAIIEVAPLINWSVQSYTGGNGHRHNFLAYLSGTNTGAIIWYGNESVSKQT